MYNCPNCGGHIRYDIPSAKIHCDSCDSSFDPYELAKKQGEGKDAEEQKTYETTLFTCPHCGGEITSTDVTAASFCTYCGSPVVLGSRISREKRPALIIPFMKTKEECKEAYRRKMRQAFFVPKELQDPEYLEKFRGIYIPYWLFDVQFHGVSSIMGSKEHREGDYIVRTEYELRGDLDAAYPNIYYDASSSFDDSIGETIAPYESKNLRPFTPSMLCGFFADTSDVESSVYKGDAETFARQEAALALSKQPAYRNFSPGSRQPFRVDAEMQKARLSMFPVWFLTWRKDDRVAYAVINGQSGKVVSDLPLDLKAFALGCGVISVVLFLLLELLVQPTPLITSVLSLTAALLMGIGLHGSTRTVFEKQTHAKDKGWTAGEEPQEPSSDGKPGKKKQKGGRAPVILVSILVLLLIFLTSTGALSYSRFWGGAVLAYSLFLVWRVSKMQKDIPEKHPLRAALALLAAVILNVALVFLSPVSDAWYYLGDALCIAVLLFSSLGILRTYNVGTTRPLPTLFDRKEV